MDIKITPSGVSGTLNAVSSKSFSHRLLICAALAERETEIRNNCFSDDILATIRCLGAMGCKTDFLPGKDGIRITPMGKPQKPSVTLDCGESGCTARFLMPVAASFFDGFTVNGTGKLPYRPFAPLCAALADAGCSFNSNGFPITCHGKIQAGNFRIAGDISSQFVSGLLFALPLLDADSRIEITTPLQSAGYVEMTVRVLAMFGIECSSGLCANGFFIKGNQVYKSPEFAVAEGDWSNAAFFLCMAAIAGRLSLKGLSADSAQGDKAVLKILESFGAETSFSGDTAAVSAGNLHGMEIDASQIPDLVPPLAVVAALAEGRTRIYNAQRLRLKESDRIQSTFKMLRSLGADAKTTDDGLIVEGGKKLHGGIVDACCDHRIVMAAATAACVCENPVVITGCDAVNKSYPSFFDDFKMIGGNTRVL